MWAKTIFYTERVRRDDLESKTARLLGQWIRLAVPASKTDRNLLPIVAPSANNKRGVGIVIIAAKSQAVFSTPEHIKFLSKLARYCNFKHKVISLNLPNRRTILTCGKRAVVVYLICKIYNYISSRTMRFGQSVTCFVESGHEAIIETPMKVV